MKGILEELKSHIGVSMKELLEQLKKHSTHMKEKEFEKDYAAGISFAVKVIEDGEFPDWIKKEEYIEE
jgi:hypothetical protein